MERAGAQGVRAGEAGVLGLGSDEEDFGLPCRGGEGKVSGMWVGGIRELPLNLWRRAPPSCSLGTGQGGRV